MNPKIPFKNCGPFKVASGQDYGPGKIVQYAGLSRMSSRIVKHVSGHLSPQYLLILLGDTRVHWQEMVVFNQPQWLILARIPL
jgi:hypothetical protein